MRCSTDQETEYNQGMSNTMTQSELMDLLRQQVQHAVGMDGSLAPGHVEAREAACAAANATMDLLVEKYGVCGEEVMDDLFPGAAF
jgi:hypothetical protein